MSVAEGRRRCTKTADRAIIRLDLRTPRASRTLPRNTARKSTTGSIAAGSSRLGRELLLIALGAVVFYCFLCLFSYSPQDPSWSFSGTGGEIENLGGRFGAFFADVLLYVFGYSSYLLPLILVLLGWRVYRGAAGSAPPLGLLLVRGGGIVVSLLALSALEHVHFMNLSAGMEFAAGGMVGDQVAAWLTLNFGVVGATVTLIVALTAGISWATGLSWFAVMDGIGGAAFEIPGRIRRGAEGAVDKLQGAKSRKRRRESVATVRKELDAHKPPRIEPRLESATDSGRREKERQEELFTNESAPDVRLPELSLLDTPVRGAGGYSKESLQHMSRLLEKKLRDFNIEVQVVAVHPGPVITRFEIDPAPGIKASQIVGLARDLARALSVVSIRVVENIPGKTFIGLELPNEEREIVNLVDGLNSQDYERSKSPLTFVMGKDISGNPVIADLAKMPHLLIAGTTGSGKSVCINALILSLLYKATPSQVRLILVDPKMLELSAYDGIPHLLAPVITDMQKAINVLRWCLAEMDRRFKLMAAVSVRNISGFNRKVSAAAQAGKPILDPMTEAGDAEHPPLPLGELPYIVVVIDELADLMMVVGKKLEELITRIAQRARAAGIHLVLATQRPSVDVVTGLIKANVPTRVAFQVSSRADSRTVLDQMGAEQLLGHGDMLFLPPGTGFLIRVHGSFVSDQEVQRVAEELRAMGRPDYVEEITEGDFSAAAVAGDLANGEAGGEADPLYDQALSFITETRRASISSVQRHLRVGYNRAARMIEAMEAAGVVGPVENGKRAVLAPPPPE